MAAQDVVPMGWRCVHIWMEAGAREAGFCPVSFVYIIQFTYLFSINGENRKYAAIALLFLFFWLIV